MPLLQVGRHLVLRGLVGQKIFLEPAHLDSMGCHSVIITECLDCYLQILAPIRLLKIAACEDSEIVAVAVASLVTARRCTRVALHIAAHAVNIESVLAASAFLWTARRPIVCGDSRNVQLAPFNVVTDKLPSLLGLSALRLQPRHVVSSLTPLCWSLLEDVDGSGGGANGAAWRHMVALLPPEQFQLLCLDERPPADGSQGCGAPLPEDYFLAVQRQKEDVGASTKNN
eukprot:GHVT01049283.1.p1 GENE.GHVT01049283.1~~GHVT01049283.1.p1  ORF type:complete len:228 (-),score=64.72 GHVT01049283.1:157-840(-)